VDTAWLQIASVAASVIAPVVTVAIFYGRTKERLVGIERRLDTLAPMPVDFASLKARVDSLESQIREVKERLAYIETGGRVR
jgi:hypothetical protein